jgi:hypothetical protein
MKRCLLSVLLLSVASVILNAQDTERFFTPYWKSGELDPARGIHWSKSSKYEDKLEFIPVPPQYIQYISEGDRSVSSDYFSIKPKYEADGTLTIKPLKPNHEVILFIDLGRVLPGTIELEANPPEGVSIRFETGEAMQPKEKYKVNTPSDGSRKKFSPQIDHANWAGMRYVWVHFSNVKEPFILFSLNGIYQVRPSNYIGNFESNDEMLNRIWEMCAYSAHAVMGQPVGNDPTPQSVIQTLCMDRIDRYPWAGDSRIIQKTVEYVFGEYELIRRANDRFFPVGIRPVPVLQAVVPYILDWALAETDYFWVSGDSAHFVTRLDDILATMEEFDPYEHPREGWFFFDWDERIVDQHIQEQSAFIGKYIQMCREAALAANRIGHKEAADKLTTQADRYTLKWKEAHPDWLKENDIHALTNLLLGNVFTENELPLIYDKVYADRSERCTHTPAFGMFILQALSRMGKQDKALEMIRDYWGTMIQAGATSTWEEWHPTWKLPVGALPPQYEPYKAWSGLSLIQPYGSGPAQWLLGEIIGIKPESPGFQQIRIEPNPSGLEWAKGAVASPLGAIRTEWKMTGKTLELNFNAPAGCQSITMVVPKGKKYLLNQKQIHPDKIEQGKAYFKIYANNGVFEVTMR